MSIGKEFSVARSRAKVKRRLKAVIAASKAAMQAEFDKSGAELVAMQKRFVPVDQGDLEASIKNEPSPGGRIGVTVSAGGGDAFHAPFVEFGTVKMEAEPFFFPPYRALRKKFKSRHRKAQRNAVKKAMESVK